MFKRGSRSKAWSGPRLPVLIMFLVLILIVSVLLFGKDSKKPDSSFGLLKQKWNSFEPSVQFHPTVELRNGTDMIWQIPDSPKAVLLLAHGCNGRAVNFWDRSPNCPKCIGLPEERLLVLHALARRFAVLTISSIGRCWTMGEERLIVKDIIRWWVETHNLEKLPLVALGASSGGYFVSALAMDLRFSSITLMIAEGMFDQMDIAEDYPPTLFVHMPKDSYRQQKIGEYMEVMRNKGIDVAEIECMEFPLSQNFLADRIPGLDQAISAKLFDLLREKGFIDENGYMRSDGRATRWKAALRESKAIFLDKNLVHHVQEELNLAFAYHEMTSLQSEQIFKWFETHMN
ncbi:Secretion-regulating guanine nucleotide exchange factor [Melia azedarach]|uniref:Secretion-regulating guanine nucleotide exchange factor n=1 Tax=Melia azedarach TaxID=155640 RepID=A0ACC1Z0T0_MELAZ|nr:Secretion-regulating guanine nucleotide exchange factor [Melia azedarach]